MSNFCIKFCTGSLSSPAEVLIEGGRQVKKIENQSRNTVYKYCISVLRKQWVSSILAYYLMTRFTTAGSKVVPSADVSHYLLGAWLSRKRGPTLVVRLTKRSNFVIHSFIPLLIPSPIHSFIHPFTHPRFLLTLTFTHTHV